MRNSYNKSVQLRCMSCGDSNFELNEDKSWIKCNRCGKEYQGGYDELVELNLETINQALIRTNDELTNDLQKEMKQTLKNAFKGDKNIKFK